MRHLMARDVRPVCFGTVSWIPGNGFIGAVFDPILHLFGRRWPPASRCGKEKSGVWVQKYKQDN
jgi:hypothetical protein